MNNILVPIDFSPCSEKALEEAITLASASSGTVHLTHIISSFASEDLPPFTDPASIYKIEEDDLKALAVEALEKLIKEGIAHPGKVSPRPIVRAGKAGREIVKIAKELNADLIVLGTHGRTGLERLIVGSTAEFVVRYAHCPVLTIKESTPTFVVQPSAEKPRAR